MSLATTADLRQILGVGSLYPEQVLQDVCNAADAVLLPMLTTPDDIDYSTDAAVVQAALMLSVDIWQARTTANGGSADMAGNPMPYRLGNSILGRIRGLIAHAVDTGSLIG